MTKQEEFLKYLIDPTKVIVDKKRDEFLEVAETLKYTGDKPEVHLEEHNTYCIIHAESMGYSFLATLDTVFNHIFKNYQKYTCTFSSTLTAPGRTTQPTVYVHKYYIHTKPLDKV